MAVATERKSLNRNEDDQAFNDLLKDEYKGKKLTDPVNQLQDKWELLPAFLKVKGLVKQHLDSFNYFVDTDLKKIIKANETILSDVDPEFYFKYLDIRVGSKSTSQGKDRTQTPHQCRLRDMSYNAPIYVDVEYTRGKKIIMHRDVEIGKMPIMLRSNKCVLEGADELEMAKMLECPLDPGGYFIVNGTEKVILVQEQLSKNRIIVEADEKKELVQASVTSSTHERKSKTYVVTKNGKIYLKHNSISEEIPIVIALKASGLVSDLEIMQLVCGNDSLYQEIFAVNFEECINQGITTQRQALEFIGSKVKTIRRQKLSTFQEGVEAIATTVIAHLTAVDMDFKEKALYLSLIHI